MMRDERENGLTPTRAADRKPTAMSDLSDEASGFLSAACMFARAPKNLFVCFVYFVV